MLNNGSKRLLVFGGQNWFNSCWMLGIRSFDFRAISHFLSKNELMSNLLKKMSDSLIRSFLVSEISDLFTSLISSERLEWIAHGRSFLVSEMKRSDLSQMRDSLTSLTKKEEMSKNKQSSHFFEEKKKTWIKHSNTRF